MPATPVQASTITNLVGPAGSGKFGSQIISLPNGNLIVTDPAFSNGSATNAGAVYLYNGKTHALISALTGSHADDQVGCCDIISLSNNNYIVSSPHWNGGTGAITWCSALLGCAGNVSEGNSVTGTYSLDTSVNRLIYQLKNSNYLVLTPSWNNNTGAVTWCSGSGGCKGAISPANSLVGSHTGDLVGSDVLANFSSIVEFTNGDYGVLSPNWTNGQTGQAGAVTRCSGTSGCIGFVSGTNSLVGNHAGDMVGSVVELKNGSYVVSSPKWSGGLGAVTFCAGPGSCHTTVSAANSLTGSQAGDQVGDVFPLSNGNFVVLSSSWNNGNGAATWCSGVSGCQGIVSAANSLVDTDTPGAPFWFASYVKGLKNGNYVVTSEAYANNTGAVTWCSGASSCTGSVSQGKSLVGAHPGDDVSIVTPLDNGNYLVSVPNFANDKGESVGSVTWCSGTGGCQGVISPGNSLIGGSTGGLGPFQTVLPDGNYLVHGYNGGLGSLTWCSGVAGCQGIISEANSLVGSQVGDGIGTATVLGNGNYVVGSPSWNIGAGAATFCSGSAGCRGVVSPANSLVGSQPGDGIGNITSLANGNYVVSGPNWANGSVAQAGAVTWCSGVTGCQGPVSAANSLVGSQAGDQVGQYISGLGNANFLAISPSWANGTAGASGAVTFCSGSSGCQGPVSGTNSLVGSHAGDQLGGAILTDGQFYSLVTTLDNGNYVVASPNWTNGTAGGAGAVTWCNGATGCQGTVSVTNSLVGSHAGDQVGIGLLGMQGGHGNPNLPSQPGIMTLGNSNYLVISSLWNGATQWTGGGAITWCSAGQACAGVVSETNSLIVDGWVTPFADGNYVVESPFSTDFLGYNYYVGPGATLGSGLNAAPVGALTSDNTLQGTKRLYEVLQPGGRFPHLTYDLANHQLIASNPDENRVTFWLPSFPVACMSVSSGDWNNPATWNGTVPSADSQVTIRSGTSVTLSGNGEGKDLTIQPGGLLTFVGGSLTLSGHFTNWGAFNGGAGILSLSGDLANDGSFVGGKGTLVINGQGEQTFSGSGSATLNNLTVRPGVTLVDGSTADLTVQGSLLNQGVIRKSLAVSGIGPLSFGLTGAQAFVAWQGGLAGLTVERIDQNLPNSNLGYWGISTLTGAYWKVTEASGPGTYNLSLGVPTRMGSTAKVCRPSGVDWDCDQSRLGTGLVWRDGIGLISGSWTVGWQPSSWIYAPAIGN